MLLIFFIIVFYLSTIKTKQRRKNKKESPGSKYACGVWFSSGNDKHKNTINNGQSHHDIASTLIHYFMSMFNKNIFIIGS